MTEATIDCGGTLHRVRMAGDTLELLDHDVTAERVLIALDAPTVPCMAVRDVWDALPVDPALLRCLVHARGMHPALITRGLSALDEHVQRRGRDAIGLVVDMEADVRAALASHALDSGHVSPSAAQVRRMLETIVNDTAHRSFLPAHSWAPVVRCEVVSHDQRPEISGHNERFATRLTCRLRPSWLASVHIRGLAVVDGAFVIDVLSERGDELTVSAGWWQDDRVVSGRTVLRREATTEGATRWTRAFPSRSRGSR